MIHQDVLEKIKTGDLLLFTKTSAKSKLVRYFSASRYSHIALAIRLIKNGDSFKIMRDEGEIYVLDLIGDEFDYDLLTDTYKNDFRLTPLENRMAVNYSLITVRHLKNPECVDLDLTHKFLYKYKDISFISGTGMIELWLDFHFRDHNPEEKGYSCSMITCQFMREVCGIDIDINIISPSFGYLESDNNDVNAKIIDIEYYPDEALMIKHEMWHQSIGIFFAFLLIWLIFWYLTADKIFS